MKHLKVAVNSAWQGYKLSKDLEKPRYRLNIFGEDSPVMFNTIPEAAAYVLDEGLEGGVYLERIDQVTDELNNAVDKMAKARTKLDERLNRGLHRMATRL